MGVVRELIVEFKNNEKYSYKHMFHLSHIENVEILRFGLKSSQQIRETSGLPRNAKWSL